jgi:hypothetical protein
MAGAKLRQNREGALIIASPSSLSLTHRGTIGKQIAEANTPSSKSLALRQKRLSMARRGGP